MLGRACATAAHYYANTDFGQVKQDASIVANQLMTGLSGWMQNYNKLDAWHRGEAIGDLRSYFLPYGIRNAATAAEIATVSASSAATTNMLRSCEAPEFAATAAALIPRSFSESWTNWWRQVCNATSKTFAKESAPCDELIKLESKLAKTEVNALKLSLVRDIFQDFGKALPAHRAAVLEALVDLDPQHLQALKNAGYKVYAPKTLADLDAGLAKQPVAYNHDFTNDYASGITDFAKKRIMVPESIKDELLGSFSSNIDAAPGTLRHEIGHALDKICGWKETRLHNQYQMERFSLMNSPNVSRKERLRLGRFIGSQYGFEETIAELFAIQNGGSSLPRDIQQYLRSFYRNTINCGSGIHQRRITRRFHFKHQCCSGYATARNRPCA